MVEINQSRREMVEINQSRREMVEINQSRREMVEINQSRREMVEINQSRREMVEINQSLYKLISSTPGVSSIFLTDRDGVPIASAGSELRSRNHIIQSYQSTLEQANKLDMGAPKSSLYFYEQRQVAVLVLSPLIVYIVASPESNAGILLKMGERMEPLLQQVEKLLSLP